MCDNWPVADFDRCTPLRRHLEDVALFAWEFLAARLDRVKAYWGEVKPFKPGDILALSALLHDIAKASTLYRRRGSFVLHEYASAVLVLRALEEVFRGMGVEGGKAATIAAAAIARHHSAMNDRNPMSIYARLRDPRGAAELVGMVRGILRGINATDLYRALPGPAGRLLASALSGAVEELSGDSRRLKSLLDRCVQVSSLSYTGKRLLWSISGYLIVADILVASVERAGRVEKAYAKYWLTELGIGEDDVKRLVEKAEDEIPQRIAALLERIRDR